MMKDKTDAQTLKSCRILEISINIRKLLVQSKLLNPSNCLFLPSPKIIRHKRNLLNPKTNGNSFVNFRYKKEIMYKV